jgi:hypothetical protein
VQLSRQEDHEQLVAPNKSVKLRVTQSALRSWVDMLRSSGSEKSASPTTMLMKVRMASTAQHRPSSSRSQDNLPEHPLQHPNALHSTAAHSRRLRRGVVVALKSRRARSSTDGVLSSKGVVVVLSSTGKACFLSSTVVVSVLSSMGVVGVLPSEGEVAEMVVVVVVVGVMVLATLRRPSGHGADHVVTHPRSTSPRRRNLDVGARRRVSR